MQLDAVARRLFKPFEAEKLIHSCEDNWGEIQVLDNGRHRVLSFGSAYEQSCVDLNAPQRLVHEYTRAMSLALAFNTPDHVTCLGLGGGALASCVLQLITDCDLDVIELRQAVVTVAQDYFALPEDPRLRIHITDAREYLKTGAEASTDLILADLYSASAMNPYQARKKFLAQCDRMLRPGGWLVINFHRLPSLNAPFFRWVQDFFPALLVCSTTSGNQVLFAGKTILEDPRDKRPQVREMEHATGMKLMSLLDRMIRIRF